MILKAFFFALIFIATIARAEADSGRFCAQTFNVYGPIYASKVEQRIKAASGAVQKEPCDAIQLQELWLPQSYRQFTTALQNEGLTFVHGDSLRNDKMNTG